jgi:exodeoxyribonuclease-3
MSSPQLFVSWNVNGLRACMQKGFVHWLQKTRPHLLGLQETKVLPEQIVEQLNELTDYEVTIAPAQKKGYSGVALFCHRDYLPQKIEVGLGIDIYDNEGRTLIAHYQDVIVFNCYFPNGQRDHGRVSYKLDYSETLVQRALDYKEQYKKEIIIMGDVNTAHQPIDLARPKSNVNTTGFLPIERNWLTTALERGLHDVFREQHLDQEGHYTWWTYRGDCRDKNIGWRIDYFLTSTKLAEKVKRTKILSDVLGSDHCPITLEF